MNDRFVAPQDLESDKFLAALNLYAREHLKNIFIGGLSVLSRILGNQHPKVECVVFDTEIASDFFEAFEGQCIYTISAVPYPEMRHVKIGEKSSLIFDIKNFQDYCSSTIEQVIMNARTFEVFFLKKDDDSFQNKTVSPQVSEANFPEKFWGSLVTLCHLPGFTFKCPNFNKSRVFFNDPNDENYVFKAIKPYVSDYIPEYGPRLISTSLTSILEGQYFPFTTLYTYISDILGQEMFIISSEMYNQSLISFNNFITNSPMFSLEMDPGIKLAILAIPLFLFEKEYPDAVNHFFTDYPLAKVFIQFSRMHIVDYDISHLVFWFFTFHYCLPSKIVKRALNILFAWNNFMKFEGSDYGYWAYIEGNGVWREAMCLAPSSMFNIAHAGIRASGSLPLLSKPKITFSRNDLAHAHGFLGTYQVDMDRLFWDLYSYMKSHPDATYQEYRNQINRGKEKRRNYRY